MPPKPKPQRPTREQVRDSIVALAQKAGVDPTKITLADALAHEGFNDTLTTEAIMTRSDYSRRLNELDEIRVKWEGDYNQLMTEWKPQIEAQLAEAQTRATTAETELASYRTEFGEIDPAARRQPPGQKPEPPKGDAVKPEDVDAKLKATKTEVFNETAAFLAQERGVRARHQQYFGNDFLDLEALIEHARENKVGLQEAHAALYGEKIQAIEKTRENERVQKLVDEELQKRNQRTAQHPAAATGSAFFDNLEQINKTPLDKQLPETPQADLERDFVNAYNERGAEIEAGLSGTT